MTAPIGPTSTWWTEASRITWGCAACSTRWKSSRRCRKWASRRGSTMRAESSFLSSIRCRPPPINWDESEAPPGTVDILLKAAGTPIDAFSYEAIELLKDTAARWRTLRKIRDSAAMKTNKDPAIAEALRIPDAEIYAINVSFPELKDKAGTGLPESTAHVVRAASRGRRSTARGGGNDHHGVAGIPASAEGRWSPNRGGTVGGSERNCSARVEIAQNIARLAVCHGGLRSAGERAFVPEMIKREFDRRIPDRPCSTRRKRP